MLTGVKPVRKKILDGVAAEPAWRQADVMDDQQLDATAWRTLVAVGRRNVARSPEESVFSELQSHA